MRSCNLGVAARLMVMVILLIGMPAARQATAGGLIDPGLPKLVATLLPSVVSITTTRYQDIQVPTGQSVMAQVAKPDQTIGYGLHWISLQLD